MYGGFHRLLKAVLILFLVVIALGVIRYTQWRMQQPHPGQVRDEALLANRDASTFQAADEDYFHDVDGGIDLKADAPAADKTALIKGRNTWLVWSGGNDRLWDKLIYRSAGALDLLKVLSSHPALLKVDPRFSRDHRWEYFGLNNDPCFEKATAPDPDRWGLWIDKRRADCKPDPFENETKYPGVKIGSRGTTVNGKPLPVGSYYGYETGILGLRLFPNPDFDAAAAKRWNPVRYYTDPAYYNDKNLIRPYRVGMACGFCHIGPNPLKPPADPNNPKLENLSSTVGAQYFRIERIFYWEGDKSNFAWQIFHTSRPGALDTSFIPTDSINNPRTMNALYLLRERLDNATRFGKETLAGPQQNNKQLNDYVKDGPLTRYAASPSTVFAPHVLKDGSDSVGALAALNRVFINIGTFSEEWLLHFNPMVGGVPTSPIPVDVARKNSAYFAATETMTPDIALFFLSSTTPHHLKDAPGGAAELKKDEALLPLGKHVFADRCARCHSSKLPEFPTNIPAASLERGQGCNGKNYLDCWYDYWDWTLTDDFRKKMRALVDKPDFLDHNYLSNELRVPVNLLETNACSALATNATEGNVWDNFSSQSYKELPSIGSISWYQPFTGERKSYAMPAGGRGYTRVPSLVSLWSTAPFLLNNSLGKFNPDPSVAGRLDSFNDSIHQLLWPETREKDAVLGDKIPGKIDRITQSAYLKVSYGYLPNAIQQLRGIARFFPWLIDDKDKIVRIGPIPAGTPVGLVANIDALSSSSNPVERLKHDQQVLKLVLTLSADLSRLPADATDEQARQVFSNAVEPMLTLSKCPDLIVNRGHYFGTDKFSSEPALTDAEKNALIAFLKRM